MTINSDPGAPAVALEESAPKEDKRANARVLPPAATAMEKRPVDILLEDRLNRMWIDAQRGQAVAQPKLHDVFVSAVRRAIADPVVLVRPEDLDRAAAMGLEELPTGPISGRPDDIEYAVTREVARLSTPSQREAYIRLRLAPTLEAMEIGGIGTREEHFDIVDKALTPMAGQSSAASLAIDLFRYLMSAPERERTAGYYTSLGRVARYMHTDSIDGQLTVVLVESACLGGLWDVAGRDPVPDVRMLRDSAAVAANNVAGRVGTLLQQRQVTQSPDVAKPLRVLVEISAVVAPTISADPRRAQAVISVLGLPSGPDALEALTVLARVGAVADAWFGPDIGTIEVGRLEAASAIAKGAAEGADDEVPRTLFNSGISVGRDSDDPSRIVVSMVLYALALRWAIELCQGDEYRALVDMGAVQSAGNFVASMVRLRDRDSSSVAKALELGRVLARLPRWAPLAGEEASAVQVSVRRLLAAANALRLAGPEQAGFEPGSPQLDAYLHDQTAAWRAFDEDEHFSVRAARVVTFAFARLLDNPSSGAWAIVRNLAERRRDPVTAFRSIYEPYAARPGGAAAAALDESGITTSDQWAARQRELQAPVLERISPSLIGLGGADDSARPQAARQLPAELNRPPSIVTPGRHEVAPDVDSREAPRVDNVLLDRLLKQERENERLRLENREMRHVFEQLVPSDPPEEQEA
jgi:hypothetical protein